LSELKGVLDEKIDLIDQFKAQNAILKNSLRYVSTAVDELRLQIRNVRRESRAQTDPLLQPLDSRANQLLNDVLKYNLLPDLGSAQSIEATLVDLETEDAVYPEGIAASVQNLVNHTRTILRQRVVEDDVLARISALPVAPTVDRVGAVFDRDFQAALAESDRYRNYLVAYSMVLLALLFYIGSR